MLLDSSHWKIKQKADSGDQQAQYDILLFFYKKMDTSNIIHYGERIVETECAIDKDLYVDAHLLLAATYMDSERTQDAATLLEKAHKFTQTYSFISKYHTCLVEHLVTFKKILDLEYKIEKGEQQALFDLAMLFDNEGNDRKASVLFEKIINQVCEISKEDYFTSYMYAAMHKEGKESLSIYKKAKNYMENNFPPAEWVLELYQCIIDTENEIIEQS